MVQSNHELRQDFWEGLIQKIRNQSTVLPDSFTGKTSEGIETDSWRAWGILPANASIGIGVHLHNIIYIYLYLADTDDTEGVFRHLSEYQDEIEAPFESKLYWRPGSRQKVSGKDKIILLREADIMDYPEKWNEYQKWLILNSERFYGVFSPHLRLYERQS